MMDGSMKLESHRFLSWSRLVSLSSISSSISSSEFAKRISQTDLTGLKNAVQQGAGKVNPQSPTSLNHTGSYACQVLVGNMILSY